MPDAVYVIALVRAEAVRLSVSISPITSLEAFRAALGAYRFPRVILTALELKLFTVMGRKTWSIPKLALALSVSTRGLEILCRNLAAGGLLEKRGGAYRATSFGATVLNAAHPQYRGAYLELLTSHWEDWSHLTQTVRSGRPLDGDEPDTPASRRRFTWAMHDRSFDVASRIAAQIDLHKARTLLDLGGGPGTYAMAFLARNPYLTATVCDRAAALAVAKKIAKRLNARKRLSYLALNFMKDVLPGQYDVVWYSNVLHIYSAEENRALFRRVHAALVPGGRLIIQDAFLQDPQGLYPQEVSLFAVSMLLFTERGNTYSRRETVEWLREAGFVKIRPMRAKKGSEDWDGGLLEAVRSVERSVRNARRRP